MVWCPTWSKNLGRTLLCMPWKQRNLSVLFAFLQNFLNISNIFEKRSKWTKNSNFFASKAYTTLSHHLVTGVRTRDYTVDIVRWYLGYLWVMKHLYVIKAEKSKALTIQERLLGCFKFAVFDQLSFHQPPLVLLVLSRL